MDWVTRQLGRLKVRVDSMIARAVINRVNDALKTQSVQATITEGSVIDRIEHMQPYGLSFTPPSGSECIALALGGARGHTLAICANNPGDRPKDAEEGTGGLYTGGEWRVYINADGTVCLGAKEPAGFVALAGLVDIELAKIASAISSLGGSYSPGGGVVPPEIPSVTGATKVKAE